MTTAAIAEHLYLPELPPVDVLVRTSGELRVSNFLLWQSAGAAIHFTDKTGPSSTPPSSTPRSPSCRETLSDVATTLADGRRRACPGAEDRARPDADGRGRRRGDRPPDGTSSCRPARGPARRWPTSFRPSSRASRVVVATATKALQDQLATKDLPFLERTCPTAFDWAVLKGRSNYVCLQRLRELARRRRGRPARARGHGGDHAGGDRQDRRVGRPHRDRRLRRARMGADRRHVAIGQRRQRRVPGRRSLPAR